MSGVDFEAKRKALNTTLASLNRDIDSALDDGDEARLSELIESKAYTERQIQLTDELEQRATANAKASLAREDQARIERAKKKARDAVKKIRQAAKGMDSAFAALEGCDAALTEAIQTYEACLREAGLSDNNRMRVQLPNRLKASIWHSAPNLSDSLRVERVGAARRISLEESIGSLVVGDIDR